ncbi:MAG: OmpA family protein [Bacteroidetes bacterium]|nr:OmpA family protein [Bacteroidota bacterium]
MRNLLLVICALTFALSVSAQPLRESTYATKIRNAQESLEKLDYYNALDYYEQSYDERKDYDIAITIAKLHYQLRDYKKAASWYARVFRRDKKDEYASNRFEYARALKMNGEYDDAIEEFEKYIEWTTDDAMKELAQAEISGAEFAKVAEEVEGLTVTNVGNKVNTRSSEYSPYLDPDGNTMYYAGANTDELIVMDGEEMTYIKVYASSKTDNGWGEPSDVGQAVNREGFHTTGGAVSKDGRRMFLVRNLLSGNVPTESKIYFSEKGSSGWGPANEVQGVNGEYLATHPCPGELFGNEVLFFTSDMEGGYGGMDIYYATYKGNGVYGDPVNLGPKINTAGDEETPFYRDGTIYFSSTGHPGLGGFDIFSAVWDGARWSEPANMGKGYNTSLDEKYFMLDQEGYTGLLASNREGTRSLKSRTCCDDIYYVNLKKIEIDLLARIYDKDTDEPLNGATFEIMTMVDDTPGNEQNKTNEGGNEFAFPLELDMPYKIIVSREDYFPDTITFNTVGILDSKTFETAIKLEPAPVYVTFTSEEPIVLQNIYYDFNDDKILPDAEEDLGLVLELLEEYPKMVIEMSSHTDARGEDAYNINLSQRRADSARRWLLDNKEGLPRRRIQAKGYGETSPTEITAKLAAEYDFLNEGDVLTEEFINALETEEQQEAAHQINRRTEFRIIEGPTSIKIEETRLIRRGKTEVDEPVEEKEDEKKK